MAGVRVDNVSKSFFDFKTHAELKIIDNVSFDVKDKEFVSILGVSGCGKSTLLYMIGGHERPTHGTISFSDVKDSKAHLTNTVFQEASLFPWRKVIDNVIFGPEITGGNKKELRTKAMEFINLVGLSGFESAYPSHLSGGMKQRVAIARALMNNPEVLLMDEPFASVDAQTRMIMQEQLLRIHQKSEKTTLFVTHNIDEAIFLADRLMILSARPAKVKEIIEVNIGKPRTWDLRSSKEFVDIYGRVLKSLREELERAGLFH